MPGIKSIPLSRIVARVPVYRNKIQMVCSLCGNKRLTVGTITYEGGERRSDVYCLACNTMVGYDIPAEEIISQTERYDLKLILPAKEV